MIPKQEKFLNTKPISGTVDEILNHNVDIDTDSDEHCYKEIMHEFNVTKKEAMRMYKETKNILIKDTIDLMLKEGLIYISGYENGQPLYNLVKKKTKKKK